MASSRTASRPRAEKSTNPFAKWSIHDALALDQPVIDINVPPFDRRVAAFKSALGKYTSMNQEEVLKRRDAYLAMMERLRGERRATEDQIQMCKLKEIELAKQLEQERVERKQAEELVAHNARQIKSLQERLQAKDEELKRLEAALETLKKAKDKEKRQLNKQASNVARDVVDLERILGVTIRGVGNDVLKVVYTNLDPQDTEREFFIVLDLSQHEYRVTDVSPYLAPLPALVDGLNADRDLFGFLRQIRQAFVASA